MICRKCGQEFDSNFCPNCGMRAEKSGLDLFNDDEMFDSIESNILSEADTEYKKEIGSVVISGNPINTYEDDEVDEATENIDPDYESNFQHKQRRERKKREVVDAEYNAVSNDYDEYNDTEKKSYSIPVPGKKIKQSVSNAGASIGRGIRTVVDFIFRIFKWGSGLMMLATVAQLLKGFWTERNALGSMTEFIYEKNYSEEAYLIGAACMILFALVQFFWIMSSQRSMKLGMTRRIDTGRGMFGFTFYLILGIIGGVLAKFIPTNPSALIGIKLMFKVLGNLPKAFLITNLIGLVLSVIRKLGRRN